MSIKADYNVIFQREIGSMACDLICSYAPTTDIYIFQPLSHHCEKCNGICADDCHIRLGALMRKNLIFYCYGEDEVVRNMSNGLFADLERAAIYAYKNRLPSRPIKQDGLPGEVLLDLLVQIHEPDAHKLAVRPLLRQKDDNQEIKGYDLTYFSARNGNVSLWLGQAKMGQRDYCKRGIHDDLITKFSDEYLSQQIYFIADKQAGITDEGKLITDAINKVNLLSASNIGEKRAAALIEHFQQNNITINIPCLLAYGEGSVYSNINDVAQAIDNELLKMKQHFSGNTYSFTAFKPNIIFFVFPLKDLDKLRGAGGFYSGLR